MASLLETCPVAATFAPGATLASAAAFQPFLPNASGDIDAASISGTIDSVAFKMNELLRITCDEEVIIAKVKLAPLDRLDDVYLETSNASGRFGSGTNTTRTRGTPADLRELSFRGRILHIFAGLPNTTCTISAFQLCGVGTDLFGLSDAEISPVPPGRWPAAARPRRRTG